MVIINDCTESDIYLLRLVTATFKSVGLAPVSLSVHPVIKSNKKQIGVEFSTSVTAVFVNLISHVILLPIESFYLYSRIVNGVQHRTLIAYYFDIIFRFSVMLIRIILILIFSLKRRRIVSTLNKLLRFESEFVEKLGDLNQLYSGKLSQISIFIGYLLIVIILISIFCRNGVTINLLVMTVADTLAKFIARCLMIQYSIILIFIRKRYHSLNESLLLLTDQSAKLYHPFISVLNPSKEVTMEYLIIIRQTYFYLNEITSSITQFYSMPLVFSMGYYYLGVVYSGYLFMSEINDMINGNPNIASCAIFGFWALLCIYPAIVLTNSVTSVISEINRTGNIIYKLAAVYSTHTGIKYELEQFSVELLHKNISFTAYEMIPLDNTLLTSVFGSVVTYIIILLQSSYNTKK